eukprot:CAMPEP_0202688648 /NCGR_PEP_ID=MMETSP1385-20130828/4132_1 /ASSEMBLY_ACC=CAM_ASM_000861 /TAXON_ID=933848 /ORGANISM="Elphidium margaritaceum" /LENGTH=216 /DNA_ID=CAMNT_0049343667 /DNA_START=702 /DNA_END=1352 /DNA_ORIENTATION=-
MTNNACHGHGRGYSEGVPHQVRDCSRSERMPIKCVDVNSNNDNDDGASVIDSVEGNGDEKELELTHSTKYVESRYPRHHQRVGVTLDNISLLSGMMSDARSCTNEVAVSLANDDESDDDDDSDDETAQFASHLNTIDSGDSKAMPTMMMNGSIGGLRLLMQGIKTMMIDGQEGAVLKDWDSTRLKNKTVHMPESPVQPDLFMNPASISMIHASCRQ